MKIPPHRCVWCPSKDGLKYYVDAKTSRVVCMCAFHYRVYGGNRHWYKGYSTREEVELWAIKNQL